MDSKIIRTRDFSIPFCRIFYPDDGEPWVEIKNVRTKKTETSPLSEFVSWLVHEATQHPKQCSPQE